MYDGNDRRVTFISGLTALLGLWLLIAPWLVGAPSAAVARNGQIAGVLIALFSLMRIIFRRTALLSWANVLLAAWVTVAPWVYWHITPDLRTWNYTLVGIGIIALEAVGLTSSSLRHPWSPFHAKTSGSDSAELLRRR
jgi:hypothetical protein